MSFIPRHAFPPPSLPRSYFLGHHKSGLQKMKSILSSVDLVIECRDYRVPITSRNPLFEDALEGKERMIIYTKRDLGGGASKDKNEEIISKWHHPTTTLFLRNGKETDEDSRPKSSVKRVLDTLRIRAQKNFNWIGHRVMIVGMPNVGKSSLLNALRAEGMGKGKVAATGAQPGVTRKVSRNGVKIVPSEDDVESADAGWKNKHQGVGGGVYLLDTPGVFIPHVPDAEAMMKLALCGCVKDTIIPPVMLADYLLYHLNLQSPNLYAEYATAPTNDIIELLSEIARKTGRLGKGGAVDTEATSLWMIQKWRNGFLGRFLLDDIDEWSLDKAKIAEESAPPSFNQAKKMERQRRRDKNKPEKMK
ncbi:mitochondrial gtpase [Pyrenophora seminiperda CCB06]|uniref:Mitochondrial gtpase n=1 Tax=Pyrenophora seminiperda CCB06 TaxID=1302712 RepID=A0A3M7M0I4_9PLEO|nr:mitochondrial gtpase [Pyrenophora seminiperda CCB06]